MISVESNINELLGSLRKRMSSIKDEYSVSVENRVAYAAAVDQGWEYKIVWAELEPAHRAAIIISMKERKGKRRIWEGKPGFEVTRGDGWVKFVVPPAGIMVRSYDSVKVIGKGIFSSLPAGFMHRDVKAAMTSVAQAAQGILVQNSPVDQGNLAGGWEVRIR